MTVGLDAAFCGADGGVGDLRVGDDLEVAGGSVYFCETTFIRTTANDQTIQMIGGDSSGTDDATMSLIGGGAGVAPGNATISAGSAGSSEVILNARATSGRIRLIQEDGATDNTLILNGSGLSYTGNSGDYATFGPGIVIGASGTAISDSYAASTTIDFANTTATTVDSSGITVTGAAVEDICTVGVGTAAMVTGAAFTCYVSAADTVKVRFAAAGANIDPGSATFNVRVFDP